MKHGIPPQERNDRFILTSANLLIETNTSKNRSQVIQPQIERIQSMIDAFRRINFEYGTPGSIDIQGLQELQVMNEVDNGTYIQESLSADFGLWTPHSRKSFGEHIGAVSNIVPDSAEAILLDKNRYAIELRYGEFYAYVAHAMYSDSKRRARQLDALRERLEDKPYSALMADFNQEDLPLSSRRKFKSIGMRSAFERTGKGSPVTLPTPEYKKYRSLSRRIGYELLGGGVCLDDILVSDAMNVHATGTIDADTDHRFVYASVSTPRGVFMNR